MSARIWNLLRPASSRQVLLVFLYLQANVETVPRFQAAIPCFSCSPSTLKFIEITPLALDTPKLHLQIWKLPVNVKIEIPIPKLAVIHITYLT
jgi:hypothetical protein